MAQKISRSKRIARGITLKPAEGCWINYQLYSAGLTHEEIARRAGVSGSLVTQFIRCRKNSERTRIALATALGYKSWDTLYAAAKRGARIAA
jgi:hypothetical protein